MGGLKSREASSPSDPSPALSPRSQLMNVSPDACQKWEPKPEGNVVRICSVYDGDTMTGLCVLSGGIWKISLRLKGVDCPEVRGRGSAEKEAAICVRDAVRSCCLDKICAITPHGVDKYGRLIADVTTPAHGDLACLLLRHKLGRPYAGDTRSPFSAEEISGIISEAKRLQQHNN